MTTAELSVLCEGATEYNFVTLVLAPHLRGFQVFARPVNLGGGVKKFDRFRRSMKLEVGRARGHRYFTTMIDLYALPEFPGDRRADGLRGVDRAQRIEAAMAEEFNSPNFLPYIQVHEFEALMFVDLEVLPAAFPDDRKVQGAPALLRQAVGSLAPEEINDDPATAPSKRLIRVIPTYGQFKSVVGPELARQIGLPRLRKDCPHFDAWVGRLEQLARR